MPLTIGQSEGGILSAYDFSSQLTLACVKLTKQNNLDTSTDTFRSTEYINSLRN